MLRRALGNIPISYIFLSIPLHSRGATRDRHLSRGGVRWTRQRRRGGRRQGGKRSAGPGLGAYGADDLARRTATLCGAGRGGDAPRLHRRCAPARVVWSWRPLLAQRDGAPARRPAAGDKVRTFASALLSPVGDERKRINRRRGEHEASRKPHRVRNAGRLGAFVVTNSCAFCVTHEATDASCVRRSARPRFGRGATGQAPRSARPIGVLAPSKPQGDDASPLTAGIMQSCTPHPSVLPVPLRP